MLFFALLYNILLTFSFHSFIVDLTFGLWLQHKRWHGLPIPKKSTTSRPLSPGTAANEFPAHLSHVKTPTNVASPLRILSRMLRIQDIWKFAVTAPTNTHGLETLKELESPAGIITFSLVKVEMISRTMMRNAESNFFSLT